MKDLSFYVPSQCFEMVGNMYNEEKIVTYFAPSTQARKIYPPLSSKALLPLQSQWGEQICRKTSDIEMSLGSDSAILW